MISVKRPLGRTSIAVGGGSASRDRPAPRRRCAAPAPGCALRHQATAFCAGVAGVLEADPLAVADEPAVIVDAQRRRLAGLLVAAVGDAGRPSATAAASVERIASVVAVRARP